MNLADNKRLEEIIDRIERIEKYVLNIPEEEFYRNEQLKDACHANLIIISEAITKMSRSLKGKYSEIEWKEITGFRNQIVHEYFRINWITVWQVITNDLPDLKSNMQVILNMEK